ncbi:Crp/Fnr family transcriptional regulator [Algibacter sp.]|uniref:Crp/Fnr family transcriptional regulator n=1 Tax=Algibacter sp. TaxID=1872428 RepID=UPI003C77BBF4
MNPNLEFLNSFLDVSEETYQKIEKIMTYKNLKSGDFIAKPGEISTKAYILVSGMMRAYLSSESGKEYNKNFFMPYCFAGSLTALIKKQTSKLSYEALTDCVLYEADFSDIIELCKKDIQISNLYSRVLEQIYISNEERLVELITMNATERYIALQKKTPNIDELVPQYQIASYLGITPVQLSRIRNKIKSEKNK